MNNNVIISGPGISKQIMRTTVNDRLVSRDNSKLQELYYAVKSIFYHKKYECKILSDPKELNGRWSYEMKLITIIHVFFMLIEIKKPYKYDNT